MGITRPSLTTLALSALLLTLSACGGQTLVFNGNPAPVVDSSSDSSTSDDSSSSSTDDSSSSSLDSSSLSSTVSSASVISSTSASASSIIINASSTSSFSSSLSSANASSSSSRLSSLSSSSRSSSSSSSSAGSTGAQYYTAKCASCHGSAGQGGLGGALTNCSNGHGTFTDCSTQASLASYINLTMPQDNPGSCNTDCSTKTAQVILSKFAGLSFNTQPSLLKQTAASSNTFSLLSNTDTACGVAYSENDLRPLTKQEYASAILQLTGVDLINNIGQSTYDALPPDNLVTQYYNNVTISIDSDTQKSYSLVANKIVDQLYAQDFSGIVDCSSLSSEACYNQLVNNFGCKAFRRPLTTEERASYLALYTGDNTKEGIRKVVTAMLSSAQFIYRSNIGLTLINNSNNSSLTNVLSLIDATKTIPIYTQNSVSANFTGNDILEIEVKATQSASGLWPTMRVQIGQSTFVDLIINQTSTSVYKFHITALTGINAITIANQETGAALEYQAGHNLIVSSIKLSSSD